MWTWPRFAVVAVFVAGGSVAAAFGLAPVAAGAFSAAAALAMPGAPSPTSKK